jgi:hypothetical protein
MKKQIATCFGLGAVLLMVSNVWADPFISSVTVGAQSPATLAAGASATYSISLTKTNSSGIDAYLTISGLPAGATASFSPSPVIFKGNSYDAETLP